MCSVARTRGFFNWSIASACSGGAGAVGETGLLFCFFAESRCADWGERELRELDPLPWALSNAFLFDLLVVVHLSTYIHTLW